MDYTVNSYEDGHAKAYRILNLVVERLGNVDYHFVQLIKWSWECGPDRQELRFIIVYKNRFTFTVTKSDYDMFDDEWYQSAAEEIAAWLLLQKDVSKTKSNKF